MTNRPPRKSIMRSLGEFFGHVARGFSKPIEGDRRVVRHDVQEQQTPDGTITLRRTTVEEVEIRRDPPPA